MIDTKPRGLLIPAWTNAPDSVTQKPRVSAVVTTGRYEGQTVAQVAANLRIGQAAAYKALAAGEYPKSKRAMVQERKAKRLNATGSPFSHFNGRLKP